MEEFAHIAIFGNSGSGKSTYARALARERDMPILDLDTIYWEPEKIAVPRAPAAVRGDLNNYCNTHTDWIIEGCYGDLIAAALHWRPLLIFLNPGEAACLRNCRNRPWEPHKYASKEHQDAMLAALLAWVSDYYVRAGDMSLAAHRAVFEAYAGPKREITATP